MTAEERRKLIESYGRAEQELAAALPEFPREMWQYKPAPDRWSVHEILVHLADAEANSYVRCRRLVAEPGQAVMGYDQDEWARRCDYHAQDPELAVQLFALLRRASYELIRRLPESAWAATVTHSEYGPYGFERWLEIYERHTRGHIQQMRKNLEAWRASRAASA
jgi:hypothetical protein